MESLIKDEIVEREEISSLTGFLDVFLNSMQALQVFSSDHQMLREWALQQLLDSEAGDRSPLIVNGHADFSTENLLINLRDHWKLLTPVSTTGFRTELDDFLSCYHKKVQQGVLVVTNADQLPIATQAALMHLVHLQTSGKASLKIVLLADLKITQQLRIFSPEGVSDHRLPAINKAFTQWVVQRIVAEQYADCEPLPADIFDLAHSFSYGRPEEMRWVVDKWYATMRNAAQSKRAEKLGSLEAKPARINKPAVPLSKVKTGFWNSRVMLSGLAVCALTLGVATHSWREQATTSSPIFASNSHSQSYRIQVLDTPSRITALQWVAHHPALSDEQVVASKDAKGQAHYHVEFGRFASKKAANKALQQLQHAKQLAGGRVKGAVHTV